MIDKVSDTGQTARVSRKDTRATSSRSLLREVVRKWHLYLLILPTFALVILFSYYPAASAFYHSFFWWNGVRTRWVGLDNFAQMGTDFYFLGSISNMAKLALFQMTVQLSLPLVVATIIYRLRNQRAAYLYQTLLVVPMVVPAIVGFMIWKWFYSYKGLLNIILNTVGQEQIVRAWLGDPFLALYALMFVGFPWAGGFTMLVCLAGLHQIPTEIVDAAVVDGVGTLSRFFRIELPLLRGQLRFLLILAIINGVQQFTLPLVMTSGGPGWATMVPGLRLFQTVTHEFQYGYGSAIGVVLFLSILGLTYLNQRYLRSSVEHEPTR